jgi:hypothetical protein
MTYFYFLSFFIAFLGSTFSCFGWGFTAHKTINKLAVFTLPPEMIVFYKPYLDYIEQQAVAPDKRRNLLKEEGPRHFIDLDAYPDSISLPLYWQEALKLFPEDSLRRHGIVPWHIYRIKNQLTEAFRQKSAGRILKLSADLGHYAADAHVPLHTTANYNGQKTNQHGIHGLWETRLPELFGDRYELWTGQACYLHDTQLAAWEAVWQAHAAVDSVLSFEKRLHHLIDEDRKYSFEERNGQTVRVYSEGYSKAYHKLLNGQIERQMIASIRFVGSIWYTCWVDAGQPDLAQLLPDFNLSEDEKKEVEQEKNTPANDPGCTH